MLTDRVKIQFLPPVPKSRPLSLPPLGVVLRAANQDTMIAGGNHTSVLCREAAKGVSSVALGCHHSSNNTPSVSLCSTAPPEGEPRELLRIRLGFHKAVSACCKPLSQARWACQLPFQGRFVVLLRSPSLPPLGEVPRSGKGGVAGNFESLPFNEPHPLSQPLRAASSPTGEPRYAPNLP